MNKDSENYSSYFGVTRPINPGIIVLVDFLNNYFYTDTKLPKLKELKESFDIEKIKKCENIVCKETDDNIKSMLFESFAKWVESYCFYHSYLNKNDKKIILPLTKNMLYYDETPRTRLRNILFKLLYKDHETYLEDIKNINKFLYENGNNNDLYVNIINCLDNIIDKKYLEIDKKSLDNENKIYAKNQDDNSIIFKENKKLAINFREDFDLLIKNDIFNNTDIYRKINFFTLLLNFYVMLYAINKAYDGNDIFILAKGSPDFSTDSGGFHSAALGNFSNIRERIFKVSEKFYEGKIAKYSSGSMRIGINEQNEMQIIDKTGNIWPELKDQLFEEKVGKTYESIDDFIKKYLEVSEKYEIVKIKTLARAFVELSKKRSSSVRMISTIFSSQGKEARMVYPVSTDRHKYYAMSSELTELLLKLFLSSEKKEYATLNMFLLWLENRYGIYIDFSDRIINYLSESSIKEPSNIEFSQNVEAFVNTLDSISAIEKLSDNSYIVYDSGSIGGLSWLI